MVGWGKRGRALGPSLGRQNTDRPPEVSTRGAYATFCVSDEISDMLGAMPKSLPHIIYQTAQLTFNQTELIVRYFLLKLQFISYEAETW